MKKNISFIICLLFACLLISIEVSASNNNNFPKDGEYTIAVELSGGSGKVSVSSPAEMTVANGHAVAKVVWSSPYYDFMRINGEIYYPVNESGNSAFEIPILLDTNMPVSAQTSKMSQPHEIEYTLNFDSSTIKSVTGGGFPTEILIIAAVIVICAAVFIIIKLKNKKILSVFLIFVLCLSGCGDAHEIKKTGLGNGWKPERSMELKYAKNFSVDYYSGGYALISISDSSRFLIIPQGKEIPEGIDSDICPIRQPVRNIYLVASSAMCLFDALDSLDSIRLTGTKADDYYIENAHDAIERGEILYAGKYSAPDYELIVSNGCQLAIESSMINHAPEVKEKLYELNIPVLVDQSSYEPHPLGRTEWIKLYSVLSGKEEAAESIFDEQIKYLDSVINEENTGKTVAFFHISSSGYAVARKSGDYVTKMIELAGGNYIFKNLGDSENALSTVNLEMEKFYATAKEADFIIYNSTISGELESLDELLKKSSLLKDFKAVKNGNVWCTEENLYQETTQLGLMISDIRKILTDENNSLTELNFMYKLK